MSADANDAEVNEFDTMARWTADAVDALGPEHALPAACRGSGSPDAIDWLAGRLGLGPGHTLLDSGAGVGGPAQLVAERHGVRPTLAEPMLGACRAAGRLFGRPAVAADGAALPFGTGTFDHAWSLGVLCTVPDKPPHLDELVRVTRPRGSVGLLVFVRLVDELPQEPEANHFPSEAELDRLVTDAGLEVRDRVRVADLPAAPREWEALADRVEEWIEQQHGGEDAWRAARDEEQTVVGLIEDGLVAGTLLACDRPA